MRDPTDTRARDSDLEALEATTAEQRKQELDGVKWLMSHKPGRAIVWRLLGRAGVYRTSFSPNGSQTAFNEGRRDLGLFVLGEVMEACPERFGEMQKEHSR
jgi:hypothetical protein